MVIFQSQEINKLLKSKYSDLGKASTYSLADNFTMDLAFSANCCNFFRDLMRLFGNNSYICIENIILTPKQQHYGNIN